jgi:hypothetical protein
VVEWKGTPKNACPLMLKSALRAKPRDAFRLPFNGCNVEVSDTVEGWISDRDKLITSLINEFELRPVLVYGKYERVLEV